MKILVRDLIYFTMTLCMLVIAIIGVNYHGDEMVGSLLSMIIMNPIFLILLVIPEIFFPKSELTKILTSRI